MYDIRFSNDLNELIENAKTFAIKSGDREKCNRLDKLKKDYNQLLNLLALFDMIRVSLAEISSSKTKNPLNSSFLMRMRKQTSFDFTISMIDKLEKKRIKIVKSLEKELVGCKLIIDEEDLAKLRKDIIGIDDVSTFRINPNEVRRAMSSLFDDYKEKYKESSSELSGEIDNPIKVVRDLIRIVNESLEGDSFEKQAILEKLTMELKTLTSIKPLEEEEPQEEVEQKPVEEEPIATKEEKKEVISDSDEAERYKEYSSLREIFNELQALRKQYSSDEDFHNMVVIKFSKSPQISGTTYEEIVDNLEQLRRQLEVTEQMRLIIEEVESEYEDINDKYKVREDGLTDFEYRLTGRFSSIIRNDAISSELRQELKYCLNILLNISATLSNNRISWIRKGPEEYQRRVLELKKEYYVNTILYEAMGLDAIEAEKTINV